MEDPVSEFEDRLERHEAQIEELRTIARQQAAWNEQQLVFNGQIIGLHHDLVERMERMDGRLEHLEQLLERFLQGGANGREVTP
jgi:hypothetical protein